MSAPDSAVQTRAAPTILVVDDESGFAATLADILGTRGYQTVVAENGAEGEQAVSRTPIDLAIVDLKLPDKSGVEVLSRIRELSPRTEVIMLTGQASLDSALRALNLGAFGYLEKPYDIDRLFLLIERALSRRAHRDSTTRPDRLARMLDRSPVPVFAYYPDSGQITAGNKALAQLFGLSDSDCAGLSLNMLLHNGFAQDFADHLLRLKHDGHASTDIRREYPPGKSTWFELSSALVSREPALAVAVMTDVTARIQSETESRRARQYFEAIFENLAAGVVIIDSQYEIQQANPGFARFYRTTPNALVGRKCYEVIHGRPTPCPLHGEVCPITNCLAIGTTVSVQHRHNDADGRPHYQECTMTPLRDETGTMVSFVAMFADFTEIKQAQEDSEAKSNQLEKLNRELTDRRELLTAQAVELERTNAELVRLATAKDDFVSMVSHELRTPLTAISEGINLVADGSLGPLKPQQTQFLSLAHRNCIRLTELINDLLDLSKIEAGRMEVRRTRMDVVRAANEVSDTFAALARDKGLELSTSGADAPVYVHADERLVRRILTNLVNNALKFTDHGSVRITVESQSSEAAVSIRDTGIGIPQSEQSRMFEKFHQVARQDRGRPPGTGLGLAITRQMVEMNRGRIWFESRENAGTSFTFTLPLQPETARPAPTEEVHG
jgi:PAS domain S-box-containing protein